MRDSDIERFEEAFEARIAALEKENAELKAEVSFIIQGGQNQQRAFANCINERDTLKAKLDRANEVLNKNRAEDCNCARCLARITKEADIKCAYCGYNGKPIAIQCQCYEFACSGGESRGAGCLHGVVECPSCDGGEVDIAEIVKDVRLALAPEGAAGIAPDLTGDLSSEEFIRRVREGKEPKP